MRTKRRAMAGATLWMIALLLAACTATRARRGEPEESGFLKDDAQLASHPDYPAALVYMNPGVDWARYDSVSIESTSLWLKADTALSTEDQQMLTDTLYTALQKEVGKYFTLSTQAGPNSLRLRAALTEAQGAKVAARMVTTVVPQLRIAGGLVGLAGDTATTVSSATVEMEVLDSITAQRLAAAVDARAGTKVLFAKRAYSTWGDVEAACEFWAKRVAWQFARAGVQHKPNVGMPEEPKESKMI